MRPSGTDICSRFEARLPEILGLDGDGSESDPERADLISHGEGCSRCAEVLRTYRSTVELLRGLPRRSAPPNFLDWVKSGKAGPSRGPM